MAGRAFSPAQCDRLFELARRLPPVACGGFEFSLTDPRGPVDLMQFFVFDGRGQVQLRRFLERQLDEGDVAAHWLRDHVLPAADRLNGVWVECDAEAADDAAPSLFVEFQTEIAADAALIDALTEGLPLENREEKRRALAAIQAALPERARISHLGAMLARADAPLRVNIKDTTACQFDRFARAIGLDIDAGPAKQLIAGSYRSTLCIDITDRILPRLGVEFRFSGWPAREQGWRQLAEYATAGPIDAHRWAALERWDYVLTPADAESAWPDTLMLQELAAQDGRMASIECGPSHIKATFSPLHATTLKAYVGFRPSWRLPDGGTLAGDGQRPLPEPGDRTIDGAITRACDFLLAERTQSGLWRDFAFSNLHSDEWVSGYVGAQLLEIGGARLRAAAETAWRILRDRRAPGEGWGYQATTPPDADSTAWVTILAQRLGYAADPVVTANGDFLRAHLNRAGGAVTDSRAMLGALAAPLPDTAAHDGWHDEHGEVTASVALAGVRRAAENLLTTQCTDGSWNGFWIKTRAYPTGLACEALRGVGSAAAREARLRAARWARDRLSDEPVAIFDLAWLIRTALFGECSAAGGVIDAAVARLVGTQRSDGGWDGSCDMIVPIAHGENDITTCIAADVFRTFTCATVAAALASVRRLRGGES